MSKEKDKPFKRIIIGAVGYTKDGRQVRIQPKDVTEKTAKRKSA